MLDYWFNRFENWKGIGIPSLPLQRNGNVPITNIRNYNMIGVGIIDRHMNRINVCGNFLSFNKTVVSEMD